MGQTSSTLFGSVKDYNVADTDHGADAIAAFERRVRASQQRVTVIEAPVYLTMFDFLFPSTKKVELTLVLLLTVISKTGEDSV